MINLLPSDIKTTMDYGRRNVRVFNWLSGVVFGILVISAVAVVGRLTILTARNQAVEQKKSIEANIDSDEYRAIEEQYGAYVTALTNTKKIYQGEILFSRLIRKVGTLLPPESRLSNISLTDKDKAVNLDFNNSAENLGPLIQTNLSNQGIQVMQRSSEVTKNAFGITLGGDTSYVNGNAVPRVDIDQSTRSLVFFVNAPDSSARSRYSAALKNGGEFTYQLVKPSLEAAGMLGDPTKSQVPVVTAYQVNGDAKYIDFSVSAQSREQVKQIESVLYTQSQGTIIETYTFTDNLELCRTKQDRKGCAIDCPAGAPSNCTIQEGARCIALSVNGCHYVLRAYYDEMFSSATMSEVTDEQKKACDKAFACTHRVNATFSQLFKNVDIIQVTSCTVSPSNGAKSCPVQLRAEFDDSAKFYLINSGVSK